MPLPPVGGQDVDELCAALLESLPDEVDPGVERRTVEPDSGRTAAWGDPAVTLECGVEAPERFESPIDVNGVVWTTRDIGPGFRWTTANRLARIAVTIPDDYENGIEIMFPLSPAVEQAVPVDPTVPDPTAPDSPQLVEPPPLGGAPSPTG